MKPINPNKIGNYAVSGMISYVLLGILFSNALIDLIKPRMLSMSIFMIVSFVIGIVAYELIVQLRSKIRK